MTREEASRLLDVHPNTLQKYEGDKRVPDADFIVRFCIKFQVDERWLLTGRDLDQSKSAHGQTQQNVDVIDVGLVAIPFYEARAGAGAHQIATDELPSKNILLPQELFLLRGIRPSNAKLMLSSGTSMEPTISDGDLIMIDASDKSRSDGIFVIGRDGGVLVKRLQWRSDGALMMISDNRTFDSETLPRDDADDLRLIGRVRMVFKSV